MRHSKKIIYIYNFFFFKVWFKLNTIVWSSVFIQKACLLSYPRSKAVNLRAHHRPECNALFPALSPPTKQGQPSTTVLTSQQGLQGTCTPAQPRWNHNKMSGLRTVQRDFHYLLATQENFHRQVFVFKKLVGIAHCFTVSQSESLPAFYTYNLKRTLIIPGFLYS